jgi:hypothetical protein
MFIYYYGLKVILQKKFWKILLYILWILWNTKIDRKCILLQRLVIFITKYGVPLACFSIIARCCCWHCTYSINSFIQIHHDAFHSKIYFCTVFYYLSRSAEIGRQYRAVAVHPICYYMYCSIRYWSHWTQHCLCAIYTV